MKCDYRLMIDNLMDLTHETYVHATSIGQPEIEEAAPVTRVEGDSAITSRFMTNIPAPPFWRAALRGNHLADDVPVDRWQICRFTPPSHVMIEVGVAHAGHGGYDAPAERKVSSIVVDFITPETDTSIWYFWGMARNFNVEDQALTETIRGGQAAIFGEDVAILESQQRNLTEQPQPAPDAPQHRHGRLRGAAHPRAPRRRGAERPAEGVRSSPGAARAVGRLAPSSQSESLRSEPRADSPASARPSSWPRMNEASATQCQVPSKASSTCSGPASASSSASFSNAALSMSTAASSSHALRPGQPLAPAMAPKT